MGLVLNTNIASLNTQRAVSKTQGTMSQAMERLSSGLRVNSAKDDAAGLAIGTRMEGQIRGLNVAARNANDGISMIQVADGALSTIGDMMLRMRELAVQASNGSYADNGTDLAALDAEYQSLATGISDMASQTKFNGLAIIAGQAATFSLQVGANNGDTFDITTTDASAYDVKGAAGTNTLLTTAGAQTAITDLDTAIDALNTDRGSYGAALNTLDFTVKNLQNAAENQSAAKSRIMDADYSAETAALSKAQVLQQAGVAMLAQANQQPQQILSLLR
jgi:flagellin